MRRAALRLRTLLLRTSYRVAVFTVLPKRLFTLSPSAQTSPLFAAHFRTPYAAHNACSASSTQLRASEK